MIENRSAGYADQWYAGISEKIQSLSFMPDSYPFSRENAFTEWELRELYFGTGRRPTHRVVFRIVNGIVEVLTVRHLAQQDVEPDQFS